MHDSAQFVLTRGCLLPILVMAGIVCLGFFAAGQSSSGIGSTAAYAASQSSAAGAITGIVPSGKATTEVMHLTLRDAITQAHCYNLATIESGEDAPNARGQRLIAPRKLLPQVSVEASENVEPINLVTFGLKVPGIPTIVGRFSYSSVDANLSQTLFSFESIQRFRAASSGEQAAELAYSDTLDVIRESFGKDDPRFNLLSARRTQDTSRGVRLGAKGSR